MLMHIQQQQQQQQQQKHGVMWRYTKLVEIHSNWCVSTTLPVISLQKRLSWNDHEVSAVSMSIE